MYLVDTNVISAVAPTRAPASPDLVAWMDTNSAALFLSAVTIAEIQDGIAKARREGAARKTFDLNAWLETLLHLYSERILPFDAHVARVAGELSDKARALGRPPGFADIIIAATATHHRLTLLTRNVKHFEPLGVGLHDPFAVLPS
ncbi:MAG: type II toxin-antitoxin system VapC family toxin [Micropepsaceae bacterium]